LLTPHLLIQGKRVFKLICLGAVSLSGFLLAFVAGGVPQATAPIAKPDLTSMLETVEVDPTGAPSIVYSTKGYFEAPNWSRDGKRLIFDQDGKMMTIPVLGGTPQPIETDGTTRCNGSHGLSPDGKLLAITCSMTGGKDARIYIVPSTGGTPREVTANPSSYFHGWSPDGKTIAFTRPHQGGGDIFCISVDGGEETRLTTTEAVSDDPDYSADGKYIYFNSNRAGATEVWRMKADGSEQEQVTFDEMNNWSPHPSPDGKWIVFISFGKGVSGHPSNKNVSLRAMSLSDKKITKVADLVGGSGTMNVNSWSPDSKHFAFVGFKLTTP
jgi:TolB protein